MGGWVISYEAYEPQTLQTVRRYLSTSEGLRISSPVFRLYEREKVTSGKKLGKILGRSYDFFLNCDHTD